MNCARFRGSGSVTYLRLTVGIPTVPSVEIPTRVDGRAVKRWDVNTVLNVNSNNRTTPDFLKNNKLNVWDFD